MDQKSCSGNYYRGRNYFIERVQGSSEKNENSWNWEWNIKKSYCHICEKKIITDTDLFIFVDNNSDLFDITKMCKVFNLTRSSYYNFLKIETRNSEIKKQSIKELIKKIWWDSFKRYGTPKITIVLKKHYNIQISQKNSSKIHERVKYQVNNHQNIQTIKI